jgi:hypothetical protein
MRTRVVHLPFECPRTLITHSHACSSRIHKIRGLLGSRFSSILLKLTLAFYHEGCRTIRSCARDVVECGSFTRPEGSTSRDGVWVYTDEKDEWRVRVDKFAE